jgi:hypothetical protein
MKQGLESLLEQLDVRAAWLDALLERHPARDLLAEYEAELVERPDFVDERRRSDPEVVTYAAGLLRRLQAAIDNLELAYRDECR